jgi:hypothetical protein
MKYGFSVQEAGTVDILRVQHRRLNQLFVDYFAARSEGRRWDLAPIICNSVRLHLMLDADIFFPAFTQASGDHSVISAARKEREIIDSLIEELAHPDPGAYNFYEQIYDLWNLVTEHIATAEHPRGLFDQCAALHMDDAALVSSLRRRHHELREEFLQRNPVVSLTRIVT